MRHFVCREQVLCHQMIGMLEEQQLPLPWTWNCYCSFLGNNALEQFCVSFCVSNKSCRVWNNNCSQQSFLQSNQLEGSVHSGKSTSCHLLFLSKCGPVAQLFPVIQCHCNQLVCENQQPLMELSCPVNLCVGKHPTSASLCEKSLTNSFSGGKTWRLLKIMTLWSSE